jgi:hypothetical protein
MRAESPDCDSKVEKKYDEGHHRETECTRLAALLKGQSKMRRMIGVVTLAS